jgi:hypothetical protein
VGANAIYGGVALIVNGLGMSDDWLTHMPWRSWPLAGTTLLATVAVPQFAAAWLVVRRHPLAAVAGLIAGAGLVVWIALQLLMLRRYFILQSMIVGFGVLEAAAAWWWRRTPLPSPQA